MWALVADLYYIGLPLALFAVFLVYYVTEVAKKPRLIIGHKQFGNHLTQCCSSLTRRFWISPAFWSHIQTTAAIYIKQLILPDIPYRRQLFDLSDGGEIALDWLDSKRGEQAPTVVIVPGTNGDSQSGYIGSLVLQAARLDYRVVVVNFRGKAGVPLRTQKTYCATWYEDVREVVNHIKKEYPGQPILAVGTSIGAVILGHYVADLGQNSNLQGACLLSPLFDYGARVSHLSEWPFRIFYNFILTRTLIQDVLGYSHLYKNLDFEKAIKSWKTETFDKHFLCPVFGFKSPEEYYKKSYLMDKLKNIKVPTLALCAEDDAFFKSKDIPSEQDIEGGTVVIAVTPRGGHLAFFEGFRLYPSYSDIMFREFCQAAVADKSWKTAVPYRQA